MEIKIKDIDRTPCHITNIGGQALIEGVMMRGPKKVAIAVRKPNQEIQLKLDPLNTLGMRYRFFRLPFIRGVVGLVEAMIIGTKALSYSAEFFEEESNAKPGFLEKKFGETGKNLMTFVSMLISVLLAVGIFILLPTWIASLIKTQVRSTILLNLVEGLIRIVIFLTYIITISKMKDIYRVFQYHGAEHKTIHCYENNLELTVENVQRFPILHPRCGTSFIFMVMIVSIIVLSFFGWPNPWMRLLIRLAMLPVIAGVSYEINRAIGKSNSKLAYFLSYPGLMLQKWATVKEPLPDQIEVAIEALKPVIPENGKDDLW